MLDLFLCPSLQDNTSITAKIVKTEGAIKNGQSRDTRNSGHTMHRTETNTTQIHNTRQQTKKDKQHEPHQNMGR